MSSVQPLVSPRRQSPSGLATVLEPVALTKTYRMGEVDVHAGERVVLYPTDNVRDGARAEVR